MKQIFLLFISLLTLSLQARYYKADLVYSDGTVKSGYATLVDNKTKAVKFRLTEKSHTEKISSGELSKVIFYNQAGNSVTAERLLNSTIRNNGEVKKFEQKEWYYVYYSDGLKVVGGNAAEIDKMLVKGEVIPGTEVSYYLGTEGSEDIYYLYYNSARNLATLGGFDLNDQARAITRQLFSETCPAFLPKVEEEKFKFKDAVEKYIELYTSACK